MWSAGRRAHLGPGESDDQRRCVAMVKGLAEVVGSVETRGKLSSGSDFGIGSRRGTHGRHGSSWEAAREADVCRLLRSSRGRLRAGEIGNTIITVDQQVEATMVHTALHSGPGC